jgi:putative polyhydroxyalkanoate system protein
MPVYTCETVVTEHCLMSNIDLHARHGLSREDAQAAADDLARDLASKVSIDYGWKGDHIHFERPGVHGTITVRDREIRVRARLGLMLMFLKPQIENEVVRYLREHFDCTFG